MFELMPKYPSQACLLHMPLFQSELAHLAYVKMTFQVPKEKGLDVLFMPSPPGYVLTSNCPTDVIYSSRSLVSKGENVLLFMVIVIPVQELMILWLEKLLRGSKHLLFLQRTRVQFQIPTWCLTIIIDSSFTGSDAFFWPLWAPDTPTLHKMYM